MSRLSDPAGARSGPEDASTEAVRLLNQRGELVLNAVDDGIYCLDSSGRTTFAND